MRNLNVMKVKSLAVLLALLLPGSAALMAASAASQLEKGKQLFAENRDEDAMDYFIDVLVNGSRAQTEEANQYINRIHNRIGGIQDPVEVDVNFKEGEAKRLKPGQNPDVLQAQMNAENAPIEGEVASSGLTQTAEQDALSMDEQEQLEAAAARYQEEQQTAARRSALAAQRGEENDFDEEETDEYAEEQEEETASSAFDDLTNPSALQARQLYAEQKLDSMKQAAIARLEKTKGVRVYFRNNLPDAIDIDSDVLFNGYKFRTEALSLLDDVYTLMALTQGAGYIILPAGSYTDNITLAGIRQAMALNSFLVHKGLSSGKLSYNMGLFDQEPPAKFANLEGLSIVFDFNADLPASIPEAASVNKLPMLSMAVVPVNNKIDPAAGEAFVVDFSVIETQNPIENWLFQVIQHAADGNYYIVRQLEGFAPVYHQVVWNARKAIIGPELACGTYTLALTAVDVQGGKRTVRRQLTVDCTQTNAKAEAKDAKTAATADDKLNYKAARLWKKPARIMKAPVQEEPVAEPAIEDPFASENAAMNTADDYAVQAAASQQQSYPSDAQYGQVPSGNPYADDNNPYGMPYETYGNN